MSSNFISDGFFYPQQIKIISHIIYTSRKQKTLSQTPISSYPLSIPLETKLSERVNDISYVNFLISYPVWTGSTYIIALAPVNNFLTCSVDTFPVFILFNVSKILNCSLSPNSVLPLTSVILLLPYLLIHLLFFSFISFEVCFPSIWFISVPHPHFSSFTLHYFFLSNLTQSHCF